MQFLFFVIAVSIAFTSEIAFEKRLLHQVELLPIIDDCEIKPANPLLCQSSIESIPNPEDETVLTDDSDSDEEGKVEVQLPQTFDEVKILFLKTMPPHAMILHRDSNDPNSNLFELHVTTNELGIRRIDKDHSNSEVWLKPSCPTVFSHIVRWLTTFNLSDQMEMKLKHPITRSQAMNLANKCNREPFHYLALFGGANCYKFARTYCDELKAIDDFKSESLENLKQESDELQKIEKEKNYQSINL